MSGPEGPATVDVRVPETFAPLPVPPQNPLRADRVALGERLFFDPVLSRDRSVSCGSCHLPERSFSDGRTRSVGVGGATGLRNAPSLLNVALPEEPVLGRWRALPGEPGARPAGGPARDGPRRPRTRSTGSASTPSTRRSFAEAFDGEGPTVRTLTYALAAYERTLVSAPTAFDRHLAGDDAALAADARAGLALFQTHCAVVPRRSASSPRTASRTTGPPSPTTTPAASAITFSDADRGTFRVPSLRAVARTAPYFHDGRFQTLEAVVAHYDQGGDATPGQSPRVRPLRLSPAERDALVAFLRTLDDAPASVDRSSL